MAATGDLDHTTFSGSLVADDVTARGQGVMVYRRGWSPRQSYSPGDVVTHAGRVYVCTLQPTTARAPGNDPLHWAIF